MPANKRWSLYGHAITGEPRVPPSGRKIPAGETLEVMPVAEHEAFMQSLPVEIIGALTLGVGASYNGKPLDPRHLKLFYPRGKAPLGVVARISEVVARIRPINTEVDQKDGPDLFWACKELTRIAEELNAQANEEASVTSHTQGPRARGEEAP